MLYTTTPLAFDSIKIRSTMVLMKEQKMVLSINELGVSHFPGSLFPGFEFSPMRTVWAVKEINEE